MTLEEPQAVASAARHDAWQGGDNYENYMGRWSRKVAPRFLDWLGAPSGCDWLEVGCGTGALSGAVLAQCEQITWPRADVGALHCSANAPKVDVAGMLRGMW